jgi:hypothetical protein
MPNNRIYEEFDVHVVDRLNNDITLSGYETEKMGFVFRGRIEVGDVITIVRKVD